MSAWLAAVIDALILGFMCALSGNMADERTATPRRDRQHSGAMIMLLGSFTLMICLATQSTVGILLSLLIVGGGVGTAISANRLRAETEEQLVMRVLTTRNIALVDPDCGCLRSPDVPLSEPCSDPMHSRSTEKAFRALDAADQDYPRHVAP